MDLIEIAGWAILGMTIIVFLYELFTYIMTWRNVREREGYRKGP